MTIGLAATSVTPLLMKRGPSDVAGFVVPVDVDAIKAVPRRGSLAHVFEERREAVSPAVADRDSASSVVRPARHIRIGAPRNHAGPYPIHPRSGHSVGHHGGRAFLSIEASARLGMSGTQICEVNRVFNAAIATTSPDGAATSVASDSRNGDQSTEPLPGRVDLGRLNRLVPNCHAARAPASATSDLPSQDSISPKLSLCAALTSTNDELSTLRIAGDCQIVNAPSDVGHEPEFEHSLGSRKVPQ